MVRSSWQKKDFFPELFVFKYMWLLVVLPKTMQMAVLVFFAMLIYNKFKVIPKQNKPLLIMVGVHILAIFWQLIMGAATMDRLAASVNTVLLWIISLFYLSMNKKEVENDNYYYKLSKYLVINLIFFFVLFLISETTNIGTFSVMGHSLSLKRLDFMSGSGGARFISLMEPPLAPSHMFLFTFPLLSVLYVNNYIKASKTICIITIALIALFSTHSRSGMMICLAAYILFVMMMFRKEGVSKRVQSAFLTFCILFGGLFAIMKYKELYEAFYSFFNSRGGSNEARFEVYTRSINKAWTESPLIGIGIKYMVDGFIPYGSHSTYIGVFYKVGIIGSVAFAIGIWNEISYVRRRLKCNEYGLYIFLQFLLYFFFLVFADIDGVNWVMVSIVSMWGTISRLELNNNKKGGGINNNGLSVNNSMYS